MVLALIAVVLILVLGGDDEAANTLGPGERAGEIFLERAGTPGPDSFTNRVLEAAVVSTTAPLVTTTAGRTTTATTAASGTTEASEAPVLALVSWGGDEPGLYGGTQDQSRCDKEAILSFLEQNPEKAAAWVAAQNRDPALAWGEGRTSLTVADLPDYFAELTPVTLIRDTRVTNHGFRDGQPTPRQSVLEAGTAVLIDVYGVPRARCACGNPLIPPVASPLPPDFVGPEWPGFDPTIIVVVVPAPTVITQITIININNGDLIIRPVGSTGEEDTASTAPTIPDETPLTIPPDITVGSGDVQVTLIWGTDSDMDLHVARPGRVRDLLRVPRVHQRRVPGRGRHPELGRHRLATWRTSTGRPAERPTAPTPPGWSTSTAWRASPAPTRWRSASAGKSSTARRGPGRGRRVDALRVPGDARLGGSSPSGRGAARGRDGVGFCSSPQGEVPRGRDGGSPVLALRARWPGCA